jgi:hypothetical protein
MTQRVCNVMLIVALTVVGALAVARTPVAAKDKTGFIHGTVYFDDNENGHWDDGEPGMPAVELRFSAQVDGEAHESTIHTQTGGGFQFEGQLAKWTIVVVPPEGYRSPQDDWKVKIETAGQVVTGIDLPLVRAIARVKGKVYYDDNGNGHLDDGEEAASGIELRFTMGDMLRTVQVWNDGSYQIDLPIGTWSVSAVPPPGYDAPASRQVTLEKAGEEAMAIIGLPLTGTAPTAPAGPAPVPVSEPVQQSAGVGFIRGTVFDDADGDGQRGEDEKGLGGVQLTFRAGDAEHSITSRDDGSYAFSGSTTTWLISATSPEGYVAAEAPREVSITSAGEEITGVDFPLRAADETGKALPASGADLAPGLVVGVLGVLFGVGLALTLIGGRSQGDR